ncbi:MAG: two-component regulator propeller domain-containing protein [Ignavibacteria bacterium]
MKIIRTILFFILISSVCFPQQIGSWRNYSNLQKTNDAYVTDEGIWAVCLGGSFYYNFVDNSFTTLNKSEGLSNNLLTAINSDAQGKIWFGGQEGYLDVYDVRTKIVKRILDIAGTDIIAKRINDIYIKGDTVCISSDIGLSLINSKTLSFIDTYRKFGSLPAGSKVKSLYLDTLFYVGTENGLAIQRTGAANLSAPESWISLTDADGLRSRIASKVFKYHDTLFVGSDNGLSLVYNNVVSRTIRALNTKSILDFAVRNDSLFIALADNQIAVYSNGVVSFPYSGVPYKKFARSNNNRLYVSTDLGVAELSGGTMKFISANGPKANLFADMKVDKNGNLYVASGGRDQFNLGFFKFDGTEWFNYDTSNWPELMNNNINRIYIAPDNAVYLGTWGRGVIKLNESIVTGYSAYNTSLIGIPKNTNYLVVLGMCTDSKGAFWLSNFLPSNRQSLSSLSKDSVWTHYTNTLSAVPVLTWGLVIDNNDTKWIIGSGTESTAGQFLYYFNKTNPLYSSDNEGWGSITVADGLSSNGVSSMVIDYRGELWAGTSQGVDIIRDPSHPKSTISSVYLLKAQNVTSIAVDALNQKWVGTQKGVFVMSSDGTSLIANYTQENSPLPSDIIESITADNNSGIVYIGTSIGLVSIATSSVSPQENLNNIMAYPNPAVIEKGSPVNINIKGLIRNSEIKVFSVSGGLITDFFSPGAGVASWDGRDRFGNYVATGIYLIVAYDKDGSNVGTAKVAVIRK